MFEMDPYPSHRVPPERTSRPHRTAATGHTANRPLEARVKPECVHLYPGVNPQVWYAVVQEGEYKDDMEGLWIQVTDWVTYVLAKHFDLQARHEVH